MCFYFLLTETITIFLNKFQYEKKKCSDEEAQEKIIKNILVNYILQVCNRVYYVTRKFMFSSDSLETEGGVNFVW